MEKITDGRYDIIVNRNVDKEIERLMRLFQTIEIGGVVKSAYVLYTSYGDSITPIFEDCFRREAEERNIKDIRWTYRGKDPCRFNMCIPDCTYCDGSKVPPCRCSWGREFIQYTFWRYNILNEERNHPDFSSDEEWNDI